MDLRMEIERLRKWGTIPGNADFVGLWLANSLRGKRTPYHVDLQGNRIEDSAVKVPGTYQIRYDSNSASEPWMYCVYDIRLGWDQWAVCTIECSHGKFRGTSDFLNLTEAISRAITSFNQADHPILLDEDEEDEEVQT